MSPPLQALRCAARFRCLADACEDTCCAGLKVPVERSAYQRLEQALSQTEADRSAFALHVLRDEETPEGYARLQHGADGGCGFLRGGLCGLHQRFGEPVLPEICSAFPRAVTRAEDSAVVTLSLACPEAARLCLLSEDGGELEPAPPELLSRPLPPARPSTPPLAAALQAAARTLHAVPGLPVSAQLLTLAQLAMRPDPETLTRLATPAAARGVQSQLRDLVFPWAKVAQLFLSSLEQRRGFASQPRFEAWLERLQARLGQGGTGSPEETVELYRERRDALDQTFPVQVGRAFRNYALYQWTRFPVAEAPSPIAYVCRLALRISLLRFLLALCASDAATPQALEAAVVETFQLSAKHLEQHPVFRELVDSVLDCTEEERFAKTLLFATFA